MNLETQVRRFEQQLDAFEKLHADELKKFEEKLATYLCLQADEVKFLREELAALKKELAEREVAETAPISAPSHPPVSEVRLSRREFLGGTSNLHRS